ncbi:flagellar hook-length control protein FliK [Desulfobacula phenolica]|uniref:Hook-length control protein FliK n=1 Tax=Desulfobacula phenolica TaxID=90732 RepID=A0A1H2DSL8_9BACT|nr:flagellar hook-length control protein FliK [Desulfobacula phenolica]SDT85889.1 hook-length control protein FliK [Desulfobacula phenolica]
MNFTFTDVSSSFSNMVQPDHSGDVMSNTDSTGSQSQLFDEKLNTALGNVERLEKEILAQSNHVQVNPLGKTMDSDKIINHLSEKLSQDKGFGFVVELKKMFLMLSNGDLKTGSIDADGLEALKKILLKAGFREKDINDFIAELSEEFENKDLTLDELFDKLFELPFEEASETKTNTDQENFLEISALPFLESIFNSLGIPREKTQEILTEAGKGNKGISLDVILENLQELQKKSFYTQNKYETSEGDGNFRQLFKQLGLEQGESKISSFASKGSASFFDGKSFEQGESQKIPLTLDDFVSSLEKLRNKISQQQAPAEVANQNDQKPMANEKSLDLFKNLFKGVELENKTAETCAFEFSCEQIKNKIKNKLLVSGNEKINPATDPKLNEAVKEMESLLSSKKAGGVDVNGQSKEMKSENAKFSDQAQISTSDVKTNETQSNLNIIKTKSSFKNLPTYVTHQVQKSLVRAINQGENILRIQLKPQELGRLMMTIDNTGNSMKVSIMTESLAAKEILTSNVSELRTVLLNSGVNLEQFDVDMNSDFKQSMADAGNQAGNSGKRNRGKQLGVVDGEGINDPISLVDALNRDGLHHFVA